MAGVTAQQGGCTIGIGRDGGEGLVEFMGKAGGQVPQDEPVRVRRHGRGASQRLRPCPVQLIITGAHADADPKPLPVATL